MTTLLERVQAEGTPLIDGDQVTFVWVGDTAPLLAGDFTDWERGTPVALKDQPEPGVWTYTISLPLDAYVEYAWFWERSSLSHGPSVVRVVDPHNRRTVWNGIDADNHWFAMPDHRPTSLTRRRKGIARGTVTETEVDHPLMLTDSPRTIWLYQPPTPDPAPLVVVWDGKDYLERAKLPAIVDNLIAAGTIPPVALALVDNAGKQRFNEYMTNDVTLVWLVDAVLSAARQHLNLTDPAQQPGSWGVLGASMGGLMALFTGFRLPHLFGRVISQSGAFGIEFAGRRSLFEEALRKFKRRKLIIWQDAGTMEWLYQPNQRINRVLRERGYRVAYRVFSGGHNYTNWRNQLPDAFAAVFGDQTPPKPPRKKK